MPFGIPWQWHVPCYVGCWWHHICCASVVIRMNLLYLHVLTPRPIVAVTKCLFTAVASMFNPLPELNPSAQRYLTRFLTGDFSSWAVHFVDISQIATHHVTRHNTPIHNILPTTPQLSISQKALGTQCNAETCRSYHT
jgi:hypothetical protein